MYKEMERVFGEWVGLVMYDDDFRSLKLIYVATLGGAEV
jgi:hypothetical protein